MKPCRSSRSTTRGGSGRSSLDPHNPGFVELTADSELDSVPDDGKDGMLIDGMLWRLMKE